MSIEICSYLRFILIVVPNELVFVLVIVTEGLVLHSKYKKNM